MPLLASITPRLVELGKIGGLGEARKKRGGGTFRLPRKDDYFTIVTMQRSKAGDLVPDRKLMDQLSSFADEDGKLRELPIFLLSNNIEDVLQSAWVWYGGSKLCARCDDEKTVTWYGDPKTMKFYDEPREGPWSDDLKDLKNPRGGPLFKLHTTFNCVIAANDQGRWGGVYKFRTTSKITADQLYGGLLHISQLTGGVLRGVPMRLVVRPIKVSPEGQTTTVYVVHVELRGQDLHQIQAEALRLAQWQLEHKEQMQEVETNYRKLLAPPGHEGPQETGDIAAEYHADGDTDDAEPEPPEQEDPLLDSVGGDADEGLPPESDDASPEPEETEPEDQGPEEEPEPEPEPEPDPEPEPEEEKQAPPDESETPETVEVLPDDGWVSGALLRSKKARAGNRTRWQFMVAAGEKEHVVGCWDAGLAERAKRFLGTGEVVDLHVKKRGASWDLLELVVHEDSDAEDTDEG